MFSKTMKNGFIYLQVCDYTYIGMFVINQSQSSVAIHVETSHLIWTTNDWFLNKLHHWAEMGQERHSELRP